MSKTVKRKNVRIVKKTFVSPFSIYWDKTNYFFLFGGALLLIIGYLILSTDPWNSTPALYIAPIILFLAYIIVFPLSIFFRKRASVSTEEDNQIASRKS